MMPITTDTSTHIEHVENIFFPILQNLSWSFIQILLQLYTDRVKLDGLNI